MEDTTNATYLFDKEDDTLGNLLRHQLLLKDSVLFAAYKRPHPLVRSMELRVISTPECTVKQVIDDSLAELIDQINDFETVFNQALTKI